MRGFGIFVLVLGVLAIIGAMAMDVSVSSGIGRVNNIGLMAERQNYTIIGGVLLVVGMIMAIAGGRGGAQVVDNSDYRACPMCAEDIKRAAIKCKHCGADVVSLNTDVNLENSEPVVLPVAEAAVENKTRVWLACGTLYIMFFGLVTALIIGRNG